MKSFEEILEEVKKQDNRKIEKMWDNVQKKKKLLYKFQGIVILTVVFLICIPVISLKLKFIIIMIILPLIAIILQEATKKDKTYGLFCEEYKQSIIKKIFNNFFGNVTYTPKEGFPEMTYNTIKTGELYDKYFSEDLFTGMIEEKNPIKVAEVSTIRYERVNRKIRKVVTFKGLVAEIKLDKSIQCEFEISKAEKMSTTNMKRITIDSQEFERYFNIYSTNDITALRILTPDVMEEIVNFKATSKKRFEIYIYNDKLYFRLNSMNLFEPTIADEKMFNEQGMKYAYDEMKFMYILSTKILKIVNGIEI